MSGMAQGSGQSGVQDGNPAKCTENQTDTAMTQSAGTI